MDGEKDLNFEFKQMHQHKVSEFLRYWLCAATEAGIKVWDLESKSVVMDLKVDLKQGSEMTAEDTTQASKNKMGVSKVDLQKVVKSSFVDKSISTMYNKLQKNLASEELLPSLWEKCKK